MRLIVNGEEEEYTGDATLDNLLAKVNPDGERVATMVNEHIVAEKDRTGTVLNEGDRIEVLMFAGGG